MKRDDLIHIVRASAAITSESEFVVIGSQAALGSFENLPEEMLYSMELDIYPARSPEKAIQIDGAIGEGSPFHEQFSYYAHGVGPETAICPRGWEDRLVRLEVVTTEGRSVWAECLEIHDLALSKCVAGRERDWEFVEAALAAQLIEMPTLSERIKLLPDAHQERVERMLHGIEARVARRRDREV